MESHRARPTGDGHGRIAGDPAQGFWGAKWGPRVRSVKRGTEGSIRTGAARVRRGSVAFPTQKRARVREASSRRHETGSERLSGNNPMNEWREEGRARCDGKTGVAREKTRASVGGGKVTLARLWRQCTVHARIGAPAEWHIFYNTYEKAGTPRRIPRPGFAAVGYARPGRASIPTSGRKRA